MPPARSPGARKRIGITLLASSLAALAFAELVTRALYGAPLAEREPLLVVRANPRRGWEMLPSSEHYTYLQHVQVNALGLRGPEVAARRAGERRVLCLGDSMIYGQGVADADTLPARLELALRAGGGDWRVVNGGLRAYNTRQELALLEELLPQLQPDVVVLAWFFNDLEEVPIDELAARLERSGPVVFDVSARWEGATVWKWRLRQLLRSSAFLMQTYDLFLNREGAPLDERKTEEAWLLQEYYFARFAELAAQHGFRLLVASIPDSRTLAGPEPGAGPEQRLRALAGRRGLEFVDLFPGLSEWVRANGHRPVLAYDGHSDATANARMAGDLARELLRAPAQPR